MTAKAALCYHLLKGDVLTIITCTKLTGFTNVAREIGRGIEREIGKGCTGFGVKVSKNRVDTKNRYKTPIFFFEYRLNKTDYNAQGIEKMKAYLKEQAKGHPDEKMFLKVCQPSLF